MECLTKLMLKFIGKAFSKELFQSVLRQDQWPAPFSSICMVSSRKTRVQGQASSEQADAQGKPQVCREMLPIHCRTRTCLSNATLECTSPAKRFSLTTVNEKKFLSTQQIQKKKKQPEQHFYNNDKNKQVHYK